VDPGNSEAGSDAVAVPVQPSVTKGPTTCGVEGINTPRPTPPEN